MSTATVTVDDLTKGDRIRFHDRSMGADYEGVFVATTRPVTREGVGISCRDWTVVALGGEPTTAPIMSVPGTWYVRDLADLTRAD